MEQLHIDVAGALLVPSSFVSGKDQFKVLAVLFSLVLTVFSMISNTQEESFMSREPTFLCS